MYFSRFYTWNEIELKLMVACNLCFFRHIRYYCCNFTWKWGSVCSV